MQVEYANLYEKRWLERFHELKEFKKKYGHCRVPQCFLFNKALGNWVHNQRRLYKKVKTGEKVKSILTEERVEMMNNLGFEWVLNRGSGNRHDYGRDQTPHDEWHAMFLELTMFKFENGHCDVSQLLDPNSCLYRWVIEQRREYLNYVYGNETKMTTERIKQLMSLGFPFPQNVVFTPSNNKTNVSIEVRNSDRMIYAPPTDIETSCAKVCLPLKKNTLMRSVS